MTVYGDVQKLEPGAEVYLFDLDATPITGGGAGDILHFHGYTQVGSITWQGVVFDPWPIETEGFEKTGDQPPVPTLTVGNVDGSISVLCQQYQDMVGAKLTVHHTFGKYLDGQPGADPDQEFPPDTWFIERKASESGDVVQFELSSAMDFGGAQLPGRQIIANLCGWISIGGYRGPFCGYTGGPVADLNDDPTSDPDVDDCSGTIAGCKLRFGAENPLPYGGFPAAGLNRT